MDTFMPTPLLLLCSAIAHPALISLTLSSKSLFKLGDEDWFLVHPECVSFSSVLNFVEEKPGNRK